MTIGRVVLFLAVCLGPFCSTGTAQVSGTWEITGTGCTGDARLTIGTWDDGEPIGKIEAPGFKSSIYNIVVEGDHISFSVDQQDKYAVVTYDYDAKVSGNTMNGTCRSEEVPSRAAAFAATRHSGG